MSNTLRVPISLHSFGPTDDPPWPSKDRKHPKYFGGGGVFLSLLPSVTSYTFGKADGIDSMKQEEQRFVIISGPSGARAGKTTLCHFLLARVSELSFSVSATTRLPRPHEKNGEDYYFLTRERFAILKKDDAFVEQEEMDEGACYGTLYGELERLRKKNKHVLFDVDVRGSLTLKEKFSEHALAVFVDPGGLDVLGKRLQQRGQNSKKDITKRLERAKREMSLKGRLDKVLTNEEQALSATKEQLLGWVQDFLTARSST